jgi:hypothetical protein
LRIAKDVVIESKKGVAGKPGEACFMYYTNHVRRLQTLLVLSLVSVIAHSCSVNVTKAMCGNGFSNWQVIQLEILPLKIRLSLAAIFPMVLLTAMSDSNAVLVFRSLLYRNFIVSESS